MGLNIGICRFSQRFDIDFYTGSASALGTDLRIQMIEGLVHLGHNVTILSEVPESQFWLLAQTSTERKHPFYDYKFMNDVQYSPGKLPKNLDILIVECSTTNVRFGGVNLPIFGDLMRQAKDLTCVVYQHGALNSEIGVALGEMYRHGAENYDPNLDEPSHFRDYFYKIKPRGNRWKIWTHSYTPNLVWNDTRARSNYEEYCEDSIYLPLGRSENFDRPLTEYRQKVDIIYIGREKTPERTQRLVELAGGDKKCCQRVLFGKWKNPPDGWYYGGFVEGHGRVYEILPMAKATIHISDPWFYKTGMLTTRLVQASSAGVAGFVDDKWHGASELFGEASFINSHEDFHDRIDSYGHEEIAASQFERLAPWEYNLKPVLEMTL